MQFYTLRLIIAILELLVTVCAKVVACHSSRQDFYSRTHLTSASYISRIIQWFHHFTTSYTRTYLPTILHKPVASHLPIPLHSSSLSPSSSKLSHLKVFINVHSNNLLPRHQTAILASWHPTLTKILAFLFFSPFLFALKMATGTMHLPKVRNSWRAMIYLS